MNSKANRPEGEREIPLNLMKEGDVAYFANGSEGDYYEDKYCSKCVHEENCAVLHLHSIWNYQAWGGNIPCTALPESKVKFEALNTLWPREDDHNGECSMFYQRS
jgi:hypothetical protein